MAVLLQNPRLGQDSLHDGGLSPRVGVLTGRRRECCLRAAAEKAPVGDTPGLRGAGETEIKACPAFAASCWPGGKTGSRAPVGGDKSPPIGAAFLRLLKQSGDDIVSTASHRNLLAVLKAHRL